MPAFYTFKRMERSLRFALDVPAEHASKFQARIKNLQHLGFAKGDRGEYTDDLVHRYFIALALNFIPKPSKVAVAVEQQWDFISKVVDMALARPDVCLFRECNGLPRDRPIIFTAEPLFDTGMPFIAVPLSERIQTLHLALESLKMPTVHGKQ
jgi:hypothetical protein